MLENMKRFTVFFALFAFSFSIQAEDKRVYSENDFINIFSGKPKARFLKYLGEPDDKQIAIKPKDASKVISRPTDNKNKKKDKMEMCIRIVFLAFNTLATSRLSLTEKCVG